MTTKESIPCIDSIDYLKTLIPIRDTIEGVDSVWLVDFVLQIATVRLVELYEQCNWTKQPMQIPSQKIFAQFLAAQQAKLENKTKTLGDFLNDGVKLVPLCSDSDCTTFTVGFYFDGAGYNICSKTFAATSKIEEFLGELNKNTLKEPEPVQVQNIKLNPDRVSISQMEQAIPFFGSQRQACVFWADVHLSACGYSPEEARAELDKKFREMVMNLVDTSFVSFGKAEVVQPQEFKLKPDCIKVAQCKVITDTLYSATIDLSHLYIDVDADKDHSGTLSLTEYGRDEEGAICKLQERFQEIMRAVIV